MLNIIHQQINGNSINLSDIKGFDEYYLKSNNYIPAVVSCFYEGQYQFLQDYLPLNSVLDLGANIGLFSLYLSPCANHIIAFEPCTQHYRLAKEILSKTDNVELINGAVSDTDGEQKFYICSYNTTASTLLDLSVDDALSPEYRRYAYTEMVKTYKMSTIMGNQYFDFVKMDIEGAEDMVLRDLSFPYEQIGLIEVSVHAIYGVDMALVMQMLKNNHFNILNADFDKLIILAEHE